jgi:hypothetical protein
MFTPRFSRRFIFHTLAVAELVLFAAIAFPVFAQETWFRLAEMLPSWLTSGWRRYGLRPVLTHV